MAVLAWRAPHQEGAFGARALARVMLVVGAVLFFGLTLRGLGLAPVLLVVVLATAWASRYASLQGLGRRWRSGSPLFCALLFIAAWACPCRCSGPG